jgi:hypothetical protein
VSNVGPAPKWLENVRSRASVPSALQSASAANEETAAPPPPPRADLLDVSAASANIDAWASVLAVIESAPVLILEAGVPMEVSAKKVKLAFEANSFYARKASAADVQEAVKRAVQKAFASSDPPAFELITGALPEKAPSIAARKEAEREALRASKIEAARTHPLVGRFLSIVGGEIRKIELAGDIPS